MMKKKRVELKIEKKNYLFIYYFTFFFYCFG